MWPQDIVPAVVPFVLVGIPLLIFLAAIVLVPVFLRRRASALGYGSTVEYLRAVPATDREKRDAADLALQGVALCVLGLLFSPIILPGLVPLFYGFRKLAFTSMGLGLVDDPDEPRA